MARIRGPSLKRRPLLPLLLPLLAIAAVIAYESASGRSLASFLHTGEHGILRSLDGGLRATSWSASAGRAADVRPQSVGLVLSPQLARTGIWMYSD